MSLSMQPVDENKHKKLFIIDEVQLNNALLLFGEAVIPNTPGKVLFTMIEQLRNLKEYVPEVKDVVTE